MVGYSLKTHKTKYMEFWDIFKFQENHIFPTTLPPQISSKCRLIYHHNKTHI